MQDFGLSAEVSDGSRRDLADRYDEVVAYGRGVDRAGCVGCWLPSLVLLVGTAALLPRIAYRRRDILLTLIPLYGCLFLYKVYWRLASPQPYWRTRADVRHA